TVDVQALPGEPERDGSGPVRVPAAEPVFTGGPYLSAVELILGPELILHQARRIAGNGTLSSCDPHALGQPNEAIAEEQIAAPIVCAEERSPAVCFSAQEGQGRGDRDAARPDIGSRDDIISSGTGGREEWPRQQAIAGRARLKVSEARFHEEEMP